KSPKACAKKQKQNPKKTEKKRKLVTNKKSPKASAKRQKIVRAEAEDVSPENHMDTETISDEEPLSKLKKIKLVAKQSSDETVKKKKKANNKFVTKCRPNKLVDVIKRLNDGQKKAVREMGFGGLLDLKITFIPQGIVEWLLRDFQHTSLMFKANKIEFLLSKDDVHDIFQLPRVGEKVELIPTGNSNKTCDTDLLKTEWRKRFGLENKSRLMSCEDAGDEFKKMFVLYTMSVFLAPTSNYTLDFKLLKTVEDVSNIRNRDWCMYVFEQLVGSVRVFKAGGGRKSFVSGCILVLMLSYLHRIDFKGEVSPHSLPLIKHWDDKKLSERVRNGASSGSLGNGFPTKTTYPICVHLDEYMLIKLPPGIENDKQIRAKAADDIHAIFLRMKRDSALFYKRYTDNMEEFKAKTAELLINDPKSDNLGSDKATTDGTPSKDNLSAEHAGETSSQLQQTLHFLKDPIYHNFVDGLVMRAKEMNDFTKGMPSFDIWTDMLKLQYKELHKKYGGCTDKDLNSDLKDEKKKGREKSSPTSVLGSRRKGESDGLGCTYDCGLADDKALVVSKFMRANQALCSNLLRLRKEVVDYCLLDDHTFTKDETVAMYSDEEYLTREDILSIRPTAYLTGRMIECWAHLLNDIDQQHEGGDEDFRMISKIFRAWDHFIVISTVNCNLKEKIIFVPMLFEDHYFCVCVNVEKAKIEVLDNTCYRNWQSTTIYKLAEIVASCMSKYLEGKKIPGADKIIDFDVVNLQFPWKTEQPNDPESGNFLMIHMIRYAGEVFEADIDRKTYRRYYWIEMAAALLLADINQVKEELLKKVGEFSKKKEGIWEMLKKKRNDKIKKMKKNIMEEDKAMNETKKRKVESKQVKVKHVHTEVPVLRSSAKNTGGQRGHGGDRGRGRGRGRGKGRGKN
ncbi:hypothetical protein RND81_13G088200, partial [Saponaria officinalis]